MIQNIKKLIFNKNKGKLNVFKNTDSPVFSNYFLKKKTVTFDFGTLEATLFYEIKSNRMPVSPGYP